MTSWSNMNWKQEVKTEKPVYKLGTSGKHDRDIKMIAKIILNEVIFLLYRLWNKK